MSLKNNTNLDVLVRDNAVILEAIRQGSLAAMRRHIQAGVPMVSWKDGKVIEIPTEELARMLKDIEFADSQKVQGAVPVKK
jgi:hypothetical protein